MGTTATGMVSVEQYLSVFMEPECDYVDGELEDRNVGEVEHSKLHGKLILLIAGFSRSLPGGSHSCVADEIPGARYSRLPRGTCGTSVCDATVSRDRNTVAGRSLVAHDSGNPVTTLRWGVPTFGFRSQSVESISV